MLASISPVATWMVHSKGFQDKQDQYWICVDLGFQPKKDPAKCLVMVLLKGFSARSWNCTFGCEIPLHICAIVTFGLLYFQIMIMIIISLTSAGGTPSLLPKHPAPSLKKSAWWWRWSLGWQKNVEVRHVCVIFSRLIQICQTATHKLEQGGVGGGRHPALWTWRARRNLSLLKQVGDPSIPSDRAALGWKRPQCPFLGCLRVKPLQPPIKASCGFQILHGQGSENHTPLVLPRSSKACACLQKPLQKDQGHLAPLSSKHFLGPPCPQSLPCKTVMRQSQLWERHHQNFEKIHLPAQTGFSPSLDSSQSLGHP